MHTYFIPYSFLKVTVFPILVIDTSVYILLTQICTCTCIRTYLIHWFICTILCCKTILHAGAEMAAALFSQTFSIGHRYPDPSSLLLSSSPPPPPHMNTPASSQPSFPGQGRQLIHVLEFTLCAVHTPYTCIYIIQCSMIC